MEVAGLGILEIGGLGKIEFLGFFERLARPRRFDYRPFNHPGLRSRALGGELDPVQPHRFPLQVDTRHQGRIVEPQRLLLFLVCDEPVGKRRRQNEPLAERLGDHSLPRGCRSEARLHSLDEALGGEPREVGLVVILEEWRAEREVDYRPLLVEFLRVPHRQRVQHEMQIGVTHAVDVRFGRRRHHDKVFVPVTAGVDLVGSGEQVHVNLEAAAEGPPCGTAHIGVHQRQGVQDRAVVARERLFESRLCLAPKLRDAGFPIEPREQFRKPLQGFHVRRKFPRPVAPAEIRRSVDAQP